MLGNVVAHIEQPVEYTAELIAASRASGVPLIEAEPDARAAWSDRVNANAPATLFPTANSWYPGANVPGKPRVFMPFVGLGPYRQLCDEVRDGGYTGFDRWPAKESVPA